MINKIKFKTTKSSGAGGQNINKRDTKVIAFIHINDIDNVYTNIQHITTKNGFIYSISQKHRQQGKNKKDAIKKLINKINNTMKIDKERVDTTTPIHEINKNKENKIHRKRKKELRKNITF